MRNYTIHCTTHGCHPLPNTPTHIQSSHSKVREVAIIWFRRVYGRAPDKEVWHSKGFMAAAEDRRGNRVCIEQINDNHLPGFDTKTGTFPLTIQSPSCWTT